MLKINTIDYSPAVNYFYQFKPTEWNIWNIHKKITEIYTYGDSLIKSF